MPLFPLLWLFSVIPSSAGAGDGGSAVRPSPLCGPQRAVRPLCACYGITAVLLTVGLPELRGNYFFLFLGSAICSTVVEWIAGHLLEKAPTPAGGTTPTGAATWTVTSVSAPSSVWGVLGLAAVQ